MEAIRCFLAVEISDEIRRQAVKLIRQLAATGANVKWVAGENLHITTNFLGDITSQDVVDVSQTVINVARRHRAFDCELVGMGAFPNLENPRTLWVGAGEGSQSLVALQEDLTGTLADLGFPPESKKKFHPHLTLGRMRGYSPPADPFKTLLADSARTELGVLPVDEVCVFATKLDRIGPKYTLIGRGRLG